jgi:hypothetical protein
VNPVIQEEKRMLLKKKEKIKFKIEKREDNNNSFKGKRGWCERGR